MSGVFVVQSLDGYWNPPWAEYQCPPKSWKSLECSTDKNYYTYRCYLVRTNGWKWSWPSYNKK